MCIYKINFIEKHKQLLNKLLNIKGFIILSQYDNKLCNSKLKNWQKYKNYLNK